MKPTIEGEREVETLTADERKRIRNAIEFRFEGYLRPGEGLNIEAEKDEEYVFSEITLEAADDSLQVELEAAILAADQGVEEFAEPDEALDLAFEFLKVRLYDYFQKNRSEHFHVDWRHYTVQQTDVRFRGRVRKPELEERADKLLEEGEEMGQNGGPSGRDGG